MLVLHIVEKHGWLNLQLYGIRVLQPIGLMIIILTSKFIVEKVFIIGMKEMDGSLKHTLGV
ncbi:MAG TPA: hypothetical protein DER04_00975 [Holosporales bacterium]|nr:MAG: hypothetical protein A3H46_06715 [Alphaproteobacteria bacterium RIFCSPLOWO2_02_FULL_43_54]HCE95331.1 hypothetical protein [Holosporales bacterium]